jgi:hypothetical protein
LKRNNNCIERDHQYSRKRDHQYSRKLEGNSRGHKNIDGISAVFDLGDVYYNYIDNQRLAGEKKWRTPAERVKIKIDLGNKYQLLNLIKSSYAED